MMDKSEQATTPEQIDIPGWVPEAVAREFVRLMREKLDNEREVMILKRLAVDPRMKSVWKELTRRNLDTGDYLYPARAKDVNQSKDKAQQAAFRLVYHISFCASRDRMTVTKMVDIQPMRDLAEKRAAVLREIADDFDQGGYVSIYDQGLFWATVLRDIANYHDTVLRNLRSPDDPMTVSNQRGDPLKGVQITIAAHLIEEFGNRFDGVAAILAAVALGQKTGSPRVSRSALSGSKTRLKKRSAFSGRNPSQRS